MGSTGVPRWLVYGLLAVVLLFELISTLPCLSNHSLGAEGAPFWQRTGYCYSDVIKLYHLRGLSQDVLPYTDPPQLFVPEWTFEYPPGVGFSSYLIALLSETRRMYFLITAATLAVAAFVTTWALDRLLSMQDRSRGRLLLFVLAPGLLVFGFHNWDLWAAALVAVGLLAAARDRPRVAAAVFAVGAAFKWWPAVLVILVAVGPWSLRWQEPEERSGAWTLRDAWDRVDRHAIGVAIATWSLFQLPAIAIDAGNWLRSITFHLRRAANPDSHVGAFQDLGYRLIGGPLFDGSLYELGGVLAGLTLIGGVLYVAYRLDRGDLPAVDAALVLVIAFTLISKVFSPQFILWILPLLVLTRIPWKWVLLVDVVNAANWLTFAPSDDDSIWLLRVAQVLALIRAALLGLFAWWLLRQRREPQLAEQSRLRRAA
ncbi:MAG: DUF2029 domain-containing protein [Actinobacteria bacterium]|nr:DUF2029 domain-containing protein [Actinomycetota bacterium]